MLSDHALGQAPDQGVGDVRSAGDLGHKMENLQPPHVVSYFMKGAAAPHFKGLGEGYSKS